MTKLALVFKKTVLAGLVALLALGALPVGSVFAAGQYDPSAPAAPAKGPITNDKLEKAWAHQLKVYEKIGKGFDRADEFTSRVQERIDQAKANGKDVSAVQAALTAFEAALKNAHPIYESVKGIINSHKCFDSNGKVTDTEQAKQTVKDMHAQLKAIKDAMNGTGKALKEAIKAFRAANPRPTQTSSTGG